MSQLLRLVFRIALFCFAFTILTTCDELLVFAQAPRGHVIFIPNIANDSVVSLEVERPAQILVVWCDDVISSHSNEASLIVCLTPPESQPPEPPDSLPPEPPESQPPEPL